MPETLNRTPNITDYDHFDMVDIKGLGPQIKATTEDGSGRLFTPEEFEAAQKPRMSGQTSPSRTLEQLYEEPAPNSVGPSAESTSTAGVEAVDARNDFINLNPPITEAKVKYPRYLTAEDLKRIKSEAKTYFEPLAEQKQNILTRRRDLDAKDEKSLQAFRDLAQARNITDADVIAKGEAKVEAENRQNRQGAVEQIVNSFYQDNPEAKGAESRTLKHQREALKKVLLMPPAQFEAVSMDWNQHDLNNMHSEALNELKDARTDTQIESSQIKMNVLDKKYGGALKEVSQLPLDRAPGGAAEKILQEYHQERQANSTQEPAVAAGLNELTISAAAGKLQTSLVETYRAEGLSEEQLTAKLDQAKPQLENWLRHINYNRRKLGGVNDHGSPLFELEQYSQLQNHERYWQVKKGRVEKYIGSMSMREVLNAKEYFNLGAELNRAVDPTGSGARAGAEALRHPERMARLWGRLMVQLETARHLSRNENLLTRSQIYFTAAERGLGDSLVTAWEKIPEAEKKKVRKNMMLGKAFAVGSIKKLAAKAAAKANVKA